MGLLDSLDGSLGGMLGKVTAAAAPGLIAAVLAKTNLGDMQGIVNQLQQGGLGAQVQSWLGNGSNMPVTPQQLQAALGDEHVKQIAEHFGVPVDQALKLLAEHLPATVDQASPDGTLQS
ncbi:MAG TPA: YidB family protein [Pseudolabrys sp.]|jgi:uncharacterized protein YidB (DUF937 family)